MKNKIKLFITFILRSVHFGLACYEILVNNTTLGKMFLISDQKVQKLILRETNENKLKFSLKRQFHIS